MELIDRQKYLNYNPMLHDFADNIQKQVIKELNTPTLPHIARLLKTINNSLFLSEIQVAALKVAHYLSINALHLNWQYSVHIELMNRLNSKLRSEYSRQIGNLSKAELHTKMSSLKVEMDSSVLALGRDNDYEVVLNHCLEICKDAYRRLNTIHSSTQENMGIQLPRLSM